jgi:sugar lactone lactonase YvrE
MTYRTPLLFAFLILVPAAAGAQFPAFVPLPGVVPEGVAVDKPGNVFVSVRDGAEGIILKFTSAGVPSMFADLGEGTIGGLAVRANGDLYVTMTDSENQGVYRVDRGGNAERVAGTEAIVDANALAFDDRGTLYITESSSGEAPSYGPGGIWRVAPGGEAELWLRDPLLTGLGFVLGFPVGANGIAYYHGALYVANTDKGLLLRIPIEGDGTAGDIDVWKQLEDVPESPMLGSPFPVMPDGLALDVHGNVYVALVSRNGVVRVDAADRTQHTIAVLGSTGGVASAPFDTPPSLAFGTGAGEQQNLFVTNLGWMAGIVPARPWPGPSLLKIPAGAPGLPLH